MTRPTIASLTEQLADQGEKLRQSNERHLAASLGMKDEQIDALFIAADGIK